MAHPPSPAVPGLDCRATYCREGLLSGLWLAGHLEWPGHVRSPVHGLVALVVSDPQTCLDFHVTLAGQVYHARRVLYPWHRDWTEAELRSLAVDGLQALVETTPRWSPWRRTLHRWRARGLPPYRAAHDEGEVLLALEHVGSSVVLHAWRAGLHGQAVFAARAQALDVWCRHDVLEIQVSRVLAAAASARTRALLDQSLA